MAPGWAIWLWGPYSILSPWIISGRVVLCATAQPSSKGRAAREHMLDVTHGCTDILVHGHAFIQTTSPYVYSQIPPSPPHTHVHIWEWPLTHMVAWKATNSKTPSHRLEKRMLPSPVKQITVSPAHILPLLSCRGTSWIASSIICIRFDGVKALATI